MIYKTSTMYLNDWDRFRLYVWTSFRQLNHLIKALQSPEYAMRYNAAEALGNIADPAAIKPLLTLALTDKVEKVSLCAIYALEKMELTTEVQKVVEHRKASVLKAQRERKPQKSNGKAVKFEKKTWLPYIKAQLKKGIHRFL